MSLSTTLIFDAVRDSLDAFRQTNGAKRQVLLERESTRGTASRRGCLSHVLPPNQECDKKLVKAKVTIGA